MNVEEEARNICTQWNDSAVLAQSVWLKLNLCKSHDNTSHIFFFRIIPAPTFTTLATFPIITLIIIYFTVVKIYFCKASFLVQAAVTQKRLMWHEFELLQKIWAVFALSYVLRLDLSPFTVCVNDLPRWLTCSTLHLNSSLISRNIITQKG